MIEYLNREAVMKELDRNSITKKITFSDGVSIYDSIQKLPTADAVEVKHGEWELKSEIHTWFEEVDEEFYVECPFCHRTEWIPIEFEEEKMLEYARKHFPYCHCGAKMDGERSSNE